MSTLKRASLVASAGDDPLSMLGGISSGPLSPVTRGASASVSVSSSSFAASAVAAPSSPSPPAPTSAQLRPHDPDEIVVDSARARDIATRVERKPDAPLYVGSGIGSTVTTQTGPPLPTRPASMSVGATSTTRFAQPVNPAPFPVVAGAAGGAAAAVSPVAAAAAASPSSPSAVAVARRSSALWSSSSLPRRSRDWNPSTALTRECLDDWDAHGRVPGEKAVMQIPDVVSYNAHDEVGSVLHSLYGTLFMTSYQLFLEPTQRRDRLGQMVQAVPLSTIDRIEMEKARGGGSSASVQHGPHQLLNYLDIYAKDGRLIRFGFMKFDECKRSYDCLQQYVFPAKEEFLFAFYYKLRTPIPAHLDGWNLYDPIEEFKRQGVNTIPLLPPHSLQSEDLRLSWANEAYTMCTSYPRVFVVPSEKYVSDLDLLVVGRFRSRGRIPVCTWKHPITKQTIWRCSQPKVGMNNARCGEDERLLSAITNFAATGEMFAIYDARPKFNARANILAGKGFENPELYKNCVKKIYFMDIQNIHVMRDSYNKLIKACQKETHDLQFLVAVTNSGWLSHLACCLKATAEMVKTIDQDKISLLIHCSDGWDRTAQLAGLCELCLDPFYRTTKGFFILVEKEWVSFGHQFARRTGHKDRNYSDDQRSCIFLQWCDTVFQLLQQFPRHFEFNSHLLVTLVHHLYSCRFGTFFYNSDMLRRKSKLREKTVSIWTYFMCSPAAIAGEFTNQLYSPHGNGSDEHSLGLGKVATPATVTTAGDAIAPEETGRCSYGRGGGDGSRSAIGTVLYPSWSLKRITLWTDYFLRWNSEQCEQVPVAMHAGGVPPFGAVTTRLGSNDATLQAALRKLNKENHVLSSAFGLQSARVRELEAELAALKAQYGVPAGGVDGADAAASSSPIAPAVEESPSPSPEDPEATAAEAEAEAAAIAALRQRLQKDVDVNLQEEAEKPEDASTL